MSQIDRKMELASSGKKLLLQLIPDWECRYLPGRYRWRGISTLPSMLKFWIFIFNKSTLFYNRRKKLFWVTLQTYFEVLVRGVTLQIYSQESYIYIYIYIYILCGCKIDLF
jgi:hypothetical protein